MISSIEGPACLHAGTALEKDAEGGQTSRKPSCNFLNIYYNASNMLVNTMKTHKWKTK
jgi:hypothetical protein